MYICSHMGNCFLALQEINSDFTLSVSALVRTLGGETVGL